MLKMATEIKPLTFSTFKLKRGNGRKTIICLNSLTVLPLTWYPFEVLQLYYSFAFWMAFINLWNISFGHKNNLIFSFRSHKTFYLPCTVQYCSLLGSSLSALFKFVTNFHVIRQLFSITWMFSLIGQRVEETFLCDHSNVIGVEKYFSIKSTLLGAAFSFFCSIQSFCRSTE